MWSICSINTAEISLNRWRTSSISPFCNVRCINCKFNFIGVNGFLISWAICRAISRQALSRSDFANFFTFASSLSTISLYSFTSIPISSRSWYTIFSFFPPTLIWRSFSFTTCSGFVIRSATILDRIKASTITIMAIFTAIITISKISLFSSSPRVKYGILNTYLSPFSSTNGIYTAIYVNSTIFSSWTKLICSFLTICSKAFGFNKAPSNPFSNITGREVATRTPSQL